MASDDPTSESGILSSRVRVPQHVVYRTFVQETVVLNLETGKYHGLNPTGGRMIDVLTSVASVAEAVNLLIEEFSVPREQIEADLSAFCLDLIERGLLAREDAPPPAT